MGSGCGEGEANADWAAVPSWEGYGSVRRSVVGLLREIRQAGGFPVPACPGWDVRDTVAHLVGICRGVENNLDPGPAGQSGLAVESLSQPGLRTLLDEWERSGGRVEAALARAEHWGKGAVLVMDAFTHEVDIRRALGVPFPVGHPAFRGAFDVLIGGLSGSVMMLGLPSFHLQADAWSWVVGTGEPTAVVRGSRADLYRSLAGRRTYRQIEQLTWSTHPGPWLPAFGWGPFRPPDQPVD
ncbi:MAG TPA: maleylpyruvate isomerase family mycothiol-dependent enzyme [Trebonia sp.]|nr:maleylpyruvate isomerase family mycothiol-dependent enzyme [Trebonia sp.]